MKTPGNLSSERWDIFCRLVDNMGDIGVCWRLARGLAVHHGRSVRLWVDDPDAFLLLCPSAQVLEQGWFLDSVEVRRWSDPFPETEVADVVVEAFACDPPPCYVERMAVRKPAPVWINLEYLSAEDWVEGVHGLVSPHPRLPLRKHFVFPGLTARTGGLLREPDLFAQRDAFRRDPDQVQGFLQGLGLEPSVPEALRVSMFAYEQPQLADLLTLWAEGDRPVDLIVPKGRVSPGIAGFLGLEALPDQLALHRGNLRVSSVPFMSQTDYDRLLWSCSLNFVRGEDSFVRAQWAALPFVWHIYRQEEDAHRVKLDAFLKHYVADLQPDVADAVLQFNHAWNGFGELALAWPAFARALPTLDLHASEWANALTQVDDLALSLVKIKEVSVK